MGSRSSHKTGLLIFGWAACILLYLCFQLAGCSNSGSKNLERSTEVESIVLAFVQVEPTRPFFRKHQTEALIKFFDVKNIKTGEWTRVHMESETEWFVTRLSPGDYELFRIQIGEGPFRSESLVNMTFQVYAEKVVYLGIWRLRVDPPKTVRLLQWGVLAEAPNWDFLLVTHPDFGDKPLLISLLQPVTTQVRLFAVAPSQPRARYFYRR